ncbi:MAG: alpha,alpha-trehalose-phosphate synthase (UDP-forming) [Ktedonobacterales bacterium]
MGKSQRYTYEDMEGTALDSFESFNLLDTVERGDRASGLDSSHAGRLIFVTNRGPIEHAFDASGGPVAHRGAGGVVSGLLCAAQDRSVSWISLAMTPADRKVARQLGDSAIEAPTGLDLLTSRLVSVPEEAYHRYYDGFSNRVLWFAQHGMCNMPGFALPDAPTLRAHWDDGYATVNRAVADAVVAELTASGATTPVMFHDYHLYLAPAFVREQMPEANLLHFIHIPWPELEGWEGMPGDMLRAIYQGLAANDVVGFQTMRDVRNFLAGVRRYLPDASISADGTLLRWRGHSTQLRVYPIAVTPTAVYASAAHPEAQAEAERIVRDLRRSPDHKIILRVDRIEPTKNIVRGFEAYDRLLREHAEWRGRVTFLTLLVPSREGLAEYRAYAERVQQVINRINNTYGTSDWLPIVALVGNDHARALACMREYDVLLVNPLIDGMNLVVKEGGLLNQRDGAIVLSRRAGAYAQLHDGVLGLVPEDIDATKHALYRALTMPSGERVELAGRVRSILLGEDASSWLKQQLDDLLSATVPPASAPATVAITPTRGLTWRLDDLRQRARDALSGQSFISLPPVPPMSGAHAPRKPITTPASTLAPSVRPEDDTGHTVQH